MSQALIDPFNTVNRHNIIPLLTSYQMMPQLLRERMIDNAIASIECSSAEIDQAYEKFYQEHQIKSEIELKTWFNNQNMTIHQLESTVIRPVKIQKFKQDNWGNQLRSYFLKRKSDLDLVIYSMIQVKDGDLAQELFFRISEGEQTFAEVANQYSQGLEAFTNGMMNPIGFGRLPKPLAQILRSMNLGEICRPLACDDFFVILRLEKIISAQLNTMTAQSLLNEMFESWVQKQITRTVG